MKKLKINPIPKPRMTRADTWKKRPCVVKYWAYKDELRVLLNNHNIKIGDNICIEFHVAMPKSWSKKRKNEMNGLNHTKRPDVDNLLKGFMDAIFEEDSHIHTVYAKKYWAKEPSIVILNCQEFLCSCSD